MNKITETGDRKKLYEGTNNGMGFALLKKEDSGDFTTVQPFSPCKDFLNEVVFTENTNIGSIAFGMNYPDKKDIFTNNVYMGVKMLPSKSGDYSFSSSIVKDVEQFKTNKESIEVFMHYFEENLGMSGRTSIEESDENRFIIKGPLEWSKSTIAISLYSLLLRSAITYSDPKEDPMEFLEKYNYSAYNKTLLTGAIPKIKAVFKKPSLLDQPEFPEEAAKKKSWSPHSIGILSIKI